MTREAELLIDMWDTLHRECHKVVTEENFDVIKKAIKALEQELRWIPVSERLPEIHNYCGKYLVTLERGWICTTRFTECDGKSWWAYDDVVAWMPLPQPYREVEE